MIPFETASHQEFRRFPSQWRLQAEVMTPVERDRKGKNETDFWATWTKNSSVIKFMWMAGRDGLNHPSESTETFICWGPKPKPWKTSG